MRLWIRRSEVRAPQLYQESQNNQLAVSLPTMLAVFSRYGRGESFSVARENSSFLLAMAAGSVFGPIIGGTSLGLVPNAVLLPILAHCCCYRQ